MTMTNTLAYFVATSATKEKSFIVMTNTLAYFVAASATKEKSFKQRHFESNKKYLLRKSIFASLALPTLLQIILSGRAAVRTIQDSVVNLINIFTLVNDAVRL
jgi:hypothetical protein